MDCYLTWFKGNAIIAIVDFGILDSHIIASVNVPSIGIGDEIGAGGHSTYINVIIEYIFTFVDLSEMRAMKNRENVGNHQIEPLGTIDHLDALHHGILSLEQS
jgi:hypothetical protein